MKFKQHMNLIVYIGILHELMEFKQQKMLSCDFTGFRWI